MDFDTFEILVGSPKTEAELFPNQHEFISALKVNLSVREDNSLLPSGIGGNFSELVFLMTHNLKIKPSVKDEFEFKLTNDEIEITIPPNPKMVDARKALTKFINEQESFVTITKENSTDVQFIKLLKPETMEIKLLVNAMEICKELSIKFDAIYATQCEISKFFLNERILLKKAFLEAEKLPESYFGADKNVIDGVKLERIDKHIEIKLMSEHPVFGPKIKDLHKRCEDARGAIFDKSLVDIINYVSAFPMHIALFAIRTQIGLSRLVDHGIDQTSPKLFDGVDKIIQKYV